MGYYTSINWAIVGPEKTIRKIYSELEDADGRINEFYQAVGIFSREDYARWKERKMKDSEASKIEIQTHWGEYSKVKLNVGTKNFAVTFETNNKYFYDRMGENIEKKFPDVKAYGMFWEEGMCYEGDGCLYTNDKEGIFWKRFSIEKRDENGARVFLQRSNDFSEIQKAVKLLTGETLENKSVKEFVRINTSHPDIFLSKLYI